MKNLPLRKRLGFALQGIVEASRKESSFRFQLAVVPLVFGALIIADADFYWWGVMSVTVGSVLAAELFNTALERVIDRLHPDQHPDIKVAKDCAAGAVLVLSISSAVIFAFFVWAHVT